METYLRVDTEEVLIKVSTYIIAQKHSILPVIDLFDPWRGLRDQRP